MLCVNCVCVGEGQDVCVCVCVCVCALSHVQLFATPWTIAHQAPLSLGLPRQGYWSGLPFPTPEDLPDPGLGPASPVSLALAGRFFTTVPPMEDICVCGGSGIISCSLLHLRISGEET